MSMLRPRLIPAAVAAAVLATALSGAVLADSVNKATTDLDPATLGTRGLTTPVLQLCPNPEPMFMEYGKGSVPYHPELSVISLTGTVKNLGSKFVPGAAPQAIELWVNWGAGAGYKAKTIPLPTLQAGQVQTIQTSFDPTDYKAKLQQYGATPKLTLIVNTNAAGIGGSKDCKLGEANIEWIYGPNAGELQAMGING
jgi:hypothetical protein